MGNALFKNELANLNNVVSEIINNENMFKNPKYSNKINDICDNYSIVLESSLNKHIKIELESLKDSIYMIPNASYVENTTLDKTFKKTDLCKLISRHYAKILEIILVIKYVYDLENNGEENLANMTMKCVQQENNIMKVMYCKSKQSNLTADTLNFSNLKGFKLFNTTLLSNKEQFTLAHNLQNALNGSGHDGCDDIFFTAKELKSQGVKTKCSIENKKDKISKINAYPFVNNFEFKVGPKNPILNDIICVSQQHILIDLRNQDKETKLVIANYNKMKDSYSSNIKKILECLLEIVEPNGSEYKLRSINNEELNKIKRKIKQTIVQFYCNTIVNFHEFIKSVDLAKHFTHNKSEPFTFI